MSKVSPWNNNPKFGFLDSKFSLDEDKNDMITF